jgi:hypothetical protein
MPHKIQLDELLIGFSLNTARGGEMVRVQSSGFASSEDGTQLVEWLDGLLNPLLIKIQPPCPFSQIDHLVAVLRRDKSAVVYLNEVQFVSTVRPKRTVKAGEAVMCDDIADIGPMQMVGIDVPDDAGVVVFFSHGWRRGLFFDLSPLGKDAEARTFKLDDLLGSLWGYVLFQNRTHLADDEWAALQQHGWFPFIGLTIERVRSLVRHTAAGWDPDELLPAIADDLKERCSGIMAGAEKLPAFANHCEVIRTSIGHFRSGDYLSTSGLLYPRIEGILRDRTKLLSQAPSFRQKDLGEAATADPTGNRLPGSLLLPDRFRDYLRDVYFANFDPNTTADVSRHSVSHGVAPEARMDLKAATLALLIVEQLVYLSSS